MALREAANESTVAILEPIDALESQSPTTRWVRCWPICAAGAARCTAPRPPSSPGYAVIHAEVPAHELSRYPIDLRSVSHGTGTFTRSFVRYDYMPAALAREVARNT